MSPLEDGRSARTGDALRVGSRLLSQVEESGPHLVVRCRVGGAIPAKDLSHLYTHTHIPAKFLLGPNK